jgi:hypothetical protein
VFTATPVLGQTVEFGPKIGVNWADMLGDDSGRAEARTGFTAGGSLVLGVSESFDIQVDGLYTQKGAQFSSLQGRFDLNTAYVEVPVLARLLFPRRADDGSIPYLVAGPAFSIEMSCEVETFGGGGVIVTQDCEDSPFQLVQETETLDVGAVVGGGVNVDVGASHSFYLEGRLNVGVRSLDDSGREVDLRNVAFQLLAGFGLGFGG